MKNRLRTNILIDAGLLVGMAAVSISGFVMNVILPSRHAIRHAGARAHASQLLGMGRHDWGTIHTWVGVALLLLLILHVAFHWKTIDAFFHKNLPNRGVRTVDPLCTHGDTAMNLCIVGGRMGKAEQSET